MPLVQLAAAVVLMASLPSPSLAGLACSGIQVGPLDDVRQAVADASEGATICISGHHRVATPLVPKANMTLEGVGGAVLDGSRVLTDHFLRNGRYVFPNQTRNSGKQSGKQCQNYPRNCYADGVFFDGVALLHVPLDKLASGRYFFDYQKNEVILADNPAGHTVELTEAGNLLAGTASGVTVKDLVVENAASKGIAALGEGWRVLNVESRWNHTTGIVATGKGFVVQGGHYHHNGQYGLSGSGDNGLVEGVESDHNDHLRFGTSLNSGSACWNAGESKWYGTLNLVVRNNYVHDGYCNGFWLDVNNRNALVEDNRFESNAGYNLISEIGYGGTIRNNSFVTRGKSYSLLIASSSDIEVYGNQITGRGIYLLQQGGKGSARTETCPSWDPSPCVHLATGNYIHDNDLACPLDVCHAAQSNGVAGFWENNHIDFNHYSVESLAGARWRIENRNVTMDEWRAKGFDINGTVNGL
jgi:Right handed beta helix region